MIHSSRKSSWLYRSYRMMFVTLDTVGFIYSLNLNFALLGSQKCCHCFLYSLPWPLLSFSSVIAPLATSERCGRPSQRWPNFCNVLSVQLKASKSQTCYFSLSLWFFLKISQSVQSLSRVWLFATPWIAPRQASLSITNSLSSLRLTSIESVMPSSHLILCRPLLLLSPIPPSIRVFSNESTHTIKILLGIWFVCF